MTRAAILLVTQNFLASEYIARVGLSYFLEVSEKRDMAISRVAVGHCGYCQTLLKEVLCANHSDKTLATLPMCRAKQNSY